MFVSFFDSIKYVGHLYPLALLRIFLGYFYLDTALTRLNGQFLVQPRLAATIMDSIPQLNVSSWYIQFLQDVVVPNWKFFAYTLTYCELIIGLSFLIGFLVRPTALLGAFIALNFVYFGNTDNTLLHQTHLALFIVLAWVGAGRCLGIDYYFYKRQRGLWW